MTLLSRREARGERADAVSGNAKPQLGEWFLYPQIPPLAELGLGVPGWLFSRDSPRLAELGLGAPGWLFIRNSLALPSWGSAFPGVPFAALLSLPMRI